MAKKSYSKRSNYTRTNQSVSAKAYKDFAYMLGRVQTGISNSNSQIKASYDAGRNKQPAKTKKPLF